MSAEEIYYSYSRELREFIQNSPQNRSTQFNYVSELLDKMKKDFNDNEVSSDLTIHFVNQFLDKNLA